jgi:riboflavin synthase alpha subunit
MFTGIVETLGNVAGVEELTDSARLSLRGDIVRGCATGD